MAADVLLNGDLSLVLYSPTCSCLNSRRLDPLAAGVLLNGDLGLVLYLGGQLWVLMEGECAQVGILRW